MQFSLDNGKTWQWEEFDQQGQRIDKSTADERGQRVLSFYADTLNLKLNADMTPVKDQNGLFVYGTFDDIAAQLEDFLKKKATPVCTRWCTGAGLGPRKPDRTRRFFRYWTAQPYAGIWAVLMHCFDCAKKADALGMKILLCMLSHFFRANADYDYHFPAYILNNKGVLTRRAGWDGEWSEWLDSFMVNMRNFDNIETLAEIGIQLTKLGFGLRIDVGHGFDTVFPIDQRQHGAAKLFGEVTTGGFEPVDLRKTEEPNIPLLYMCYKIQKTVANALLVYSEQWHGNETRMLKSGTIPYNSVIKNLESIRSGQTPDAPLGLNDNLVYLSTIYQTGGGQTMSLFNSHDEESPASNYQNMIWPASAFLVLQQLRPHSCYHNSRLPGPNAGTMSERFDIAYTECWKHWSIIASAIPGMKKPGCVSRFWRITRFFRDSANICEASINLPTIIRHLYGACRFLSKPGWANCCFLRIQKSRYSCVYSISRIHTTKASKRWHATITILMDHSVIKPDGIYEMVERYNNAEGRTRRDIVSGGQDTNYCIWDSAASLNRFRPMSKKLLIKMIPSAVNNFSWILFCGISDMVNRTAYGIHLQHRHSWRQQNRVTTALSSSANILYRWQHGFVKRIKPDMPAWQHCWPRSAKMKAFAARTSSNH